MILNPNKTKALVISRFRIVSPPHGNLVLSGVSIRASPNHDILGVKFDSKLTFEYHVRGIVFRVSQKIGILRLVKRIFVDTSVLLRCYFAFVLPVLRCGVSCWMSPSAPWTPGVLGGQLCPNQSFLSLCHRRREAGLSMLYKINSNSNHCLSASFYLLLLEFDIPELQPQLIHWSLKYQGVERPNLL